MGDKENESATNSIDRTLQTKNDARATAESIHKSLLVPALIVALLSLTAGILTPPILTYLDEFHPLGGSNAVQRWIAGNPPRFSSCNQEALSHFLHEKPVRGLHVVCFDQMRENHSLTMKLFKMAHLDPETQNEVIVRQKSSRGVSWRSVQKTLTKALRLPSTNSLRQPWAIFTPVGERIVSQDDTMQNSQENDKVIKTLIDSGMVLLYEGGQWLWPGVCEGYKRSVDLYSIIPGEVPETVNVNKTRTVVLETISLEPLVLSVEGFLSPFECDHVQEVATPSMRYSEVALMDSDHGKDASEWRTSQTAFVSGHDDVFRDLEYRTASLVRIPKDHQEDLQVLRYGLNEHYVGHHDFFDPHYYSKDPETLEWIQYGRRNRLATVFWYLSDVAKGGETAFPRAAGRETESHCEEGLMVKPQIGKVIIFYSLTAAGEMDDRSLHAACPVKEGIKWAANKWVWSASLDDDEQESNGAEYDDDDE